MLSCSVLSPLCDAGKKPLKRRVLPVLAVVASSQSRGCSHRNAVMLRVNAALRCRKKTAKTQSTSCPCGRCELPEPRLLASKLMLSCSVLSPLCDAGKKPLKRRVLPALAVVASSQSRDCWHPNAVMLRVIAALRCRKKAAKTQSTSCPCGRCELPEPRLLASKCCHAPCYRRFAMQEKNR